MLDEADRCLDLGFSAAINSIVSCVPAERQTLLFSATQTRNIADLARLSLTNPVLVSVHENASVTTPENLRQSYIVAEVEHKVSAANRLIGEVVQSRRRPLLGPSPS